MTSTSAWPDEGTCARSSGSAAPLARSARLRDRDTDCPPALRANDARLRTPRMRARRPWPYEPWTATRAAEFWRARLSKDRLPSDIPLPFTDGARSIALAIRAVGVAPVLRRADL